MAQGQRSTRWYALVRPVQRVMVNPVARRVGRLLASQALVETVGRKSGLPRHTPVGGRLIGSTFWLVSEFGYQSQYVRNIVANPRVRLRIGDQWRTGVATLLDEDDARDRLAHLPRINSLLVRLVGNELLTVRIDLD